jgi:hypothetical protein
VPPAAAANRMRSASTGSERKQAGKKASRKEKQESKKASF